MKQPPSQSVEPPLIYRNVWSVDVSNSNKNRQQNQLTLSSSEPSELESMRKDLKKIRHLLDSRFHKEEEQRYADDKENEMKNDWMLAAAVLDRICAIAVTVLFVVGTVVLFVLFAKHTWLLLYTRQLQDWVGLVVLQTYDCSSVVVVSNCCRPVLTYWLTDWRRQWLTNWWSCTTFCCNSFSLLRQLCTVGHGIFYMADVNNFSWAN